MSFTMLGRLKQTVPLCRFHARAFSFAQSKPAGVAESRFREFVLSNTQICTLPSLTPELKFRLITPDCELYRATEPDLEVLEREKGVQAPFWGFYWPGGQALTRYVLDNPHLVNGKKVLDIGSGCGATAIAAKLGNCSHVTANDIDPVALVATHTNAHLNATTIDCLEERNLLAVDPPSTGRPPWDVILAGDICYCEEFASMALDWLKKHKKLGAKVLLGDPGRAYLPSQQLKCVASYQLPANVEDQNYGLTKGMVWSFDD